MADKVYFMCELAWEMLSKNELKLHYKLFPERIKTYFPEAIKEEELDHWHFDMLQQTLLIRDADGNYQFAHKSLAEFFVAYKFASELGILADEFLEMAKESICDNKQKKSLMTWSEYFKKASEKCPPLEGFKIEKLENLRATIGNNTLSPEIKQLLAGMVDNRRRKGLINFIGALKGKKFDEVQFVGSNILTLMNECGEFQPGKREDLDLSDLVLRHVDLYGANLKGYNFNSSDLSNATLHSADLTGANFSGAVLKSANLFSTTLTDADFSKADFTDAKVADVKDVLDAIVDDSKRFVIFIVDDGTARLWDSTAGKELRYFEHKGVEGAIWSKNSRKILTWDISGIVKLWDVATGKNLQSINCEYHVENVIWSKDEKEILTWGPDGFRLWDVDTEKIIYSIEPLKSIEGFIWSENERKILTWGPQGLIRLWDLATGEELQSIDNEHEVEGVLWSKDEKEILTWSPDGIVKLWDTATGKIIHSIEYKEFVEGVLWSNDEKEILTWDEDSISLFDIIEGKKIESLIYGGYKREEYEWEEYEGEECELERGWISSGVIWSKDGKRIFAWRDESAVFWDISKRRKSRKLEFRTFYHYYEINGACWFKDGEEILTWSKDGTAKIWDAKTGRAIKTFVSKINCEGMNISNAIGLDKDKYISLLYKGAVMSVSEIKDLKLSLQTHLNIIFN